jgi:hypothetical protein
MYSLVPLLYANNNLKTTVTLLMHVGFKKSELVHLLCSLHLSLFFPEAEK